jgi:hypothetical protein
MWMWLAFIGWLVLTIAIFGMILPALRAPAAGEASFMVYEYLRDWQTGLGAIIGFLGLMFVEIVRRTVERHDRRIALKDAVGAEIKGMRDDLQLAATNLDAALRPAAVGCLLLSTAQIAVLKSMQFSRTRGIGPDLGLLPHAARKAVLVFYDEYRRASSDVSALLECLEKPSDLDHSFVHTLGRTARQTLGEAIHLADGALRALGRNRLHAVD